MSFGSFRRACVFLPTFYAISKIFTRPTDRIPDDHSSIRTRTFVFLSPVIRFEYVYGFVVVARVWRLRHTVGKGSGNVVTAVRRRVRLTAELFYGSFYLFRARDETGSAKLNPSELIPAVTSYGHAVADVTEIIVPDG